jgi:hypothetical protein
MNGERIIPEGTLAAERAKRTKLLKMTVLDASILLSSYHYRRTSWGKNLAHRAGYRSHARGVHGLITNARRRLTADQNRERSQHHDARARRYTAR